MFDESNELIMSSIATAIADGRMTPEEANKLLNTFARTEERLKDINRNASPTSR